MLRAALICLLFTATVVAEDSPLVALAKRTNRAKPKAKVITNDTLAKDGGRFSTTVTQPPINVPPPTAASTTSKQSKPATAPASQQPADYAGRDVRTDVRGMQWLPATASNPQTSQNIAPVSTQKPIAAESPYKPAEAPSTAKTINPDSTARDFTPESSQSQSATPPQ